MRRHWRDEGRPGHGGDLAEVAPLLEPAAPTVHGTEQVAVLGAGKDQAGVGRVHAADPQLMFAGTKYGHLFRSTDAGRSWFKEWRDFSEITSIAWTPHVAPVHAHAQSIL